MSGKLNGTKNAFKSKDLKAFIILAEREGFEPPDL
jgi:hypothetical protein